MKVESPNLWVRGKVRVEPVQAFRLRRSESEKHPFGFKAQSCPMYISLDRTTWLRPDLRAPGKGALAEVVTKQEQFHLGIVNFDTYSWGHSGKQLPCFLQGQQCRVFKRECSSLSLSSFRPSSWVRKSWRLCLTNIRRQGQVIRTVSGRANFSSLFLL